MSKKSLTKEKCFAPMFQNISTDTDKSKTKIKLIVEKQILRDTKRRLANEMATFRTNHVCPREIEGQQYIFPARKCENFNRGERT